MEISTLSELANNFLLNKPNKIEILLTNGNDLVNERLKTLDSKTKYTAYAIISSSLEIVKVTCGFTEVHYGSSADGYETVLMVQKTPNAWWTLNYEVASKYRRILADARLQILEADLIKLQNKIDNLKK